MPGGGGGVSVKGARVRRAPHLPSRVWSKGKGIGATATEREQRG